METAQEIELLALVERLAPSDLPQAAAILLKAWCDAKGLSHDSMYEFYRGITEHQSGDVRAQLERMGATYRFGQIVGSGGHAAGQRD